MGNGKGIGVGENMENTENKIWRVLCWWYCIVL